MSSERQSLALTALLLALSVQGVVRADDPVRLEARPATCVAVHRGETCYRQITLLWPPLDAGSWCLTSDGAAEPLACWRDDDVRRWSFDYASADEETFRLRGEGRGPGELASVTVRTAWVYRSKRRGSTSWRLF